MSYFPILSAPDCTGFTQVSNFPPNNWEFRTSRQRYVNVTWRTGERWISRIIDQLPPGNVLTVRLRDIQEFVPESCLPLLSLTELPLPESSPSLPTLDTPKTVAPAWRAAVGLSTGVARTSYQGEIDPFPPKASLLTFCPFLQFGANVSNFLLLLNIEKSPELRTVELDVYEAGDMVRRVTFKATNNDLSIFCLDELEFRNEDLPLFVCGQMAAIPLYLTKARDGASLSLEHTHPPASLVVHGKRWQAQKLVKDLWFRKASGR